MSEYEPDPTTSAVREPEILFENDELLVMNKPAGLLVHRSKLDAHEKRFALQWLRDHVGYHVYPLHRLDKGTSGALAFAKSPTAANKWSALWQTPSVTKHYTALVRGWPTSDMHIDHELRDPDSPPDSERKPAKSKLSLLQRFLIPEKIDRYPESRFALVELSPITGRRHQLRQHCKHIAHPIIGDVRYGKGSYNRWLAGILGANQLLLHAERITFNENSGKVMITAPLDKNWGRVLHYLAPYAQ
jgi:tRNA pseudouridine65 synthase